jgi:hypothetical protein
MHQTQRWDLINIWRHRKRSGVLLVYMALLEAKKQYGTSYYNHGEINYKRHHHDALCSRLVRLASPYRLLMNWLPRPRARIPKGKNNACSGCLGGAICNQPNVCTCCTTSSVSGVFFRHDIAWAEYDTRSTSKQPLRMTDTTSLALMSID